VWSGCVVVLDPCGDHLASLVEIEEQCLVQELVAHLAVEALDIAVLHGFAGSDVVPVDAVIPGPGEDGMGSQLGAVVRDNHSRPPSALDDGRQLPRHSLARDRGVGDRAQAFVGHVVGDVEDPEAAAIGHLVVHEVERPAGVGPGLDKHGGSDADSPLAAFAPANTEPFFAVEPVNAVDARWLALPSQQDEQAPIAEPAPLIGQIAQPGPQFPLRRPS